MLRAVRIIDIYSLYKIFCIFGADNNYTTGILVWGVCAIKIKERIWVPLVTRMGKNVTLMIYEKKIPKNIGNLEARLNLNRSWT